MQLPSARGPRLARGTAACLLAVAFTAGCDDGGGASFFAGWPGSGDGPAAQLGQVERNVDHASTVAVQSRQVHGGNGTIQLHGKMSWKDGDLGRFTMSGKGLGIGLFGVGDGDSRKTVVVSTDTASYVRIGGALAKTFGGKKWLKMTYAALAEQEGAAGKVVQDSMARSTSPVSSVALLRASGDVKLAGTEPVRGQRCKHYVGTVDATKVTADSDPNLKDAQISALRSQLESLGMTTEQIDLWVNDKGLPLRTTTTINSSQGNYSTVQDYSDYGTDVDIEVPSDADVVDIGGLVDHLPDLAPTAA